MLLALLVACDSSSDSADSGNPGDSADTSETGDTADTAGTAVATWYFGTSQGELPDGTYQAKPDDLLFIRTLDPAAATITEEVWTEGAPKWAHYLLVHDVNVAASTFTSVWVTADGTLDVSGGYDAGAAWAWTAWHSTSTYRDGTYAGTYVTSEDSMDGKGVASAHKSVWDPDGTETWRIVEALTPTTEGEFDAAFAEIKVE